MSDLTIKQLCEQSHALSKAKGWWGKDEALIALANAVLEDQTKGGFHQTARRLLAEQRDEERKIPEKLMLLVSEVAEALESHRAREPLAFYVCKGCGRRFAPTLPTRACCEGQPFKPEGMSAECADVAIRLGDFCQRWGIDLERAIREKHAYNATREHRHGGKVC